MSQKKIHEISVTNTMDITVMKKHKGMKGGIYTKKQLHHIKYFVNGRTITAVMTKANANIKGVGIAKCNPKDEINIETGMIIAEMRARQSFYKNTLEDFLK